MGDDPDATLKHCIDTIAATIVAKCKAAAAVVAARKAAAEQAALAQVPIAHQTSNLHPRVAQPRPTSVISFSIIISSLQFTNEPSHRLLLSQDVVAGHVLQQLERRYVFIVVFLNCVAQATVGNGH